MSKLFYLNFGQGSFRELQNHGMLTFFSAVFFIAFFMIFYFILAKMLISIIIIRYMYLRSNVQLQNEAIARIFKKRSEQVKSKWRDLFFCRKPACHGQGQAHNNKYDVSSWFKTFWVYSCDLFYKVDLKTKEELDEERTQMITTIKKEREKEKKELRRRYTKENLKNLSSEFLKLIGYLLY